MKKLKLLLTLLFALVGMNSAFAGIGKQLDRSGYTAYASSACDDSGSGQVGAVLDGTTSTFWHSNWSNAGQNHSYGTKSGGCPHFLVIDRGTDNSEMGGFGYLPRQQLNGSSVANGTVNGWKLFVTDTNPLTTISGSDKQGVTAEPTDLTTASWTQVTTGSFDITTSNCNNGTVFTAEFPTARTERYVIFEITSSRGAETGFGSCAEFYLYGMDYSVNYQDSKTNCSSGPRYLTAVKLTAPSENDGGVQTSTSTIQQNATNQPIYFDLTATETFRCLAGETVTPDVAWNGLWMHVYLYIDEGHDGFNDIEVDQDNHTAKEGNDLKSFSRFVFSDNNGYNSIGTSKAANAGVQGQLPAFKAPMTAGRYRMRYKVDWNSIDPKGNPGETGQANGNNSIVANRGCIVDVTLEVIPVYNVTINHNVNGVTEQQDVVQVVGNGTNNIGYTPTPLAKYTSRYGVTIANEPHDITADTEITINYTQDNSVLPFVPATVDADGNLTSGNYYKLKLHNRFTWSDPSTGCDKNRWYCNGTEEKGDARDYFFFTGNVFEGFSIHSVIEGGLKGFNVESKRFETVLKKYYLVDSPSDGETHGYGFNLVDTAKGINDESGNGVVGPWNTANFASPFCHFEFTAVDAATADAKIEAYRSHIASLQPVAGKRYYIVNADGCFETHDDGDHKKKVAYLDGTSLKWKSVDNLDKSTIWTWTATEGGYIVKNAANPDADIHCSDATHASEPIRLWWLSDNQFNIQDGANHVWHAGGHSSGAGKTGSIITYGGAANSPSAWRLVEVSDDLWTAACAKEALQSLTSSAETALLTDEYTSTTNLITDANQLATNAGHNELGNTADGAGIPGLVDGNFTNFFHSSWNVAHTTANDCHMLQIDFLAPRDCVQFKWWKRNNNNRPSVVEVWGTNNGALAVLAEGKNYTTVDYDQAEWNEGWTRVTTLNIDNSTDPAVTNGVPLGGFRYIRLKVTQTNTGDKKSDNKQFFTMAEIQAFEQDADLAAVIGEAKNVLNSGSEDAADYEAGITAIKSVLATPLRIALGAIVADVDSKMTTVGPTLGQYSVSAADAASRLEAARTLSLSGTDVDELQATIEELQGWTFTLNMPASNQFIRIRSAVSPTYYVTNDNMVIADADATAASTIFCISDVTTNTNGSVTGKLVGYTNGLCPVQQGNGKAESGSNANLTQLLENTTISYTIREADGMTGEGRYQVQYGGRWIYGRYGFATATSSATTTVAPFHLTGGGNTSDNERGYDFVLVEVPSLPVSIGATGYATLNLPVETSIPTGDVYVYYASSYADDVLTIKRWGEDKLPANFPVILRLKNITGEPTTLDFPIAGSTTSHDDNEFSGTTAAIVKPTGSDIYVLNAKKNDPTRVGLVKYTGANISGFKSYFEVPAGTSVRAYWEDIETAISAAEDHTMQDGVMYNLNGQRVMKSHGIVIVNGKKMVIK